MPYAKWIEIIMKGINNKVELNLCLEISKADNPKTAIKYNENIVIKGIKLTPVSIIKTSSKETNIPGAKWNIDKHSRQTCEVNPIQ